MEKKANFTKVSRTDTPLYGPRKLLICGFPPDERTQFLKIMQSAELGDVPTVWAESGQAETQLAELFELPDRTGFEGESQLNRAVIMGGITQKELHQLMGTYRKNEMVSSLWAVLTPVSENWPLKMLLEELEAERCKMLEKKSSNNP